jgi:hypothetical protein
MEQHCEAIYKVAGFKILDRKAVWANWQQIGRRASVFLICPTRDLMALTELTSRCPDAATAIFNLPD